MNTPFRFKLQLAPFFPYLHSILTPSFPRCLWRGNLSQPEIALTFDDGPHPEYTLELLKVLDQFQITASFFWLGQWVEQYPEIAQAVYQRGHWIGLHGYQHQSFPFLSEIELKQSLEKTQTAIFKACHLEPELILDVRPPNGFFLPQTLELLTAWGYRPVMWSVVPEDWLHPGVNVVTQRVIKQTQNGSIIVLHDGYFGGKDVAKTVQEIIPKLLEQNYRFVTISKFWQSAKPMI
ncbi:conserved hypothetical protein [Planktothrix serta PCC 8927]|uniref:NodB homology domain-containing protein n=1 Tax=Planktothrix serta PCC 8927 TaxID=671068 RepID=A0A7Z9E2S5_9CYAN|nr:polysaccharide deacetylase family protein [Planktothrix serta]VXD24240.1 conserved hypothetical protein [Planktothrix serta PCC 8927]